MNKQAVLWYKLINKHDEVWNARERFSFKIRSDVCQKLWEASIRALLPKTQLKGD